MFLDCVLQEDDEYIGFASLPEQVHRKAVRRGFEFTLMVVGKLNHFILHIDDDQVHCFCVSAGTGPQDLRLYGEDLNLSSWFLVS